MKTLRHHLLIIGLLFLIDRLAWAQPSSAWLDKSVKSVTSKPNKRSVDDSIGMGRLQDRFQPVRVRATQPQEDLFQLTISDDGAGRTRAAELKSKSASHRKSFGLKMTSERIALVNQLYQTHTQVRIEDLVDANGPPAGTEVVLQIPI